MDHIACTDQRTHLLTEKMLHPQKVAPSDHVYLGVDVGTANVVTVAVDEEGNPLGAEIESARVTREGIIVDYLGAVNIVTRQVESLRSKLGHPLLVGASAFPPQTETGNMRITANILEAAGLNVITMVDEPTAAAKALGISEGAVIDVGGGTTGVSILMGGEVVATDDEPTGGFQFDLVIAGGLGISIEEAEALKRIPEKQRILLPVVRPVMEKIATIVTRLIGGYPVENLYLVGGSCSFEGFQSLIQNQLGLAAHLPQKPLLVTPLGIALAAASHSRK
ncbi:MAG: ethanolamine utilization protein EutJ [Syntrophomonadaceae bacterium]|nr:ethanolamine utilization protein EutJ [Syntrophomonadaceae bacterium]